MIIVIAIIISMSLSLFFVKYSLFPVFDDLNNNSVSYFQTEYLCTSIIISLGQKKKKKERTEKATFARQEILGSKRVHT